MKKLFLMLAVVSLTVPAMGQGVVFENMTMSQAREKAARENKYVFVDCYTSWCGPCKKMSAEVFPQQKVGEYFEPRFVAVKYDIEKEEDGKALSKEHGVSVIPTYLIINPEGKLVHRFSGAYDADKFLRLLDESFDNDKAYGSLKKAYEEGDRNRDFLRKALETFTSVRDPQTQEVLGELVGLLSDKEKTSPDYWFIYATDQLDTIGSANEKYLFDNAAKFRKNVGADKVDPVLARHYEGRFDKIIGLDETISERDMAKLAKQVRKLGLGGDLPATAEIATAVVSGDNDRLVDVAVQNIPKMKNAVMMYFKITDRIQNNGTPDQQRKWLALGEELLPGAPENMKSWMEAALKIFKEKTGL